MANSIPKALPEVSEALPLVIDELLDLYTNAVSKRLVLRTRIYRVLLDTLISSSNVHQVDHLLIWRVVREFMIGHRIYSEQQVRSHFQVFKEILFDLFNVRPTLLEFRTRQHYLWWIRYASIQIGNQVHSADLESLRDLVGEQELELVRSASSEALDLGLDPVEADAHVCTILRAHPLFQQL